MRESRSQTENIALGMLVFCLVELAVYSGLYWTLSFFGVEEPALDIICKAVLLVILVAAIGILAWPKQQRKKGK